MFQMPMSCTVSTSKRKKAYAAEFISFSLLINHPMTPAILWEGSEPMQGGEPLEQMTFAVLYIK